MRNQFGWDYPPGVTGMEPQIVGYPPCRSCGHDMEEHFESEGECFFDRRSWTNACTCQGYDQYPPEPDPDEAYDRARERRL